MPMRENTSGVLLGPVLTPAWLMIMFTGIVIGPTPPPLMVTVLLKVPATLPTGSVFTQMAKVWKSGKTWTIAVRGQFALVDGVWDYQIPNFVPVG